MKRSPASPARRSRGISLVELMIGLTLSLFILGALAQAFAFASEARREQETLARLMDGGRAASEIMGRAVRMASYWGCVGTDFGDLTLHPDGSANPADALGGEIATRGLFALDSSASSLSAELVTWQALDNVQTSLSSAVNMSTDTSLATQSTTGFGAGDWVSLNDCKTGDVFRTQSGGAAFVFKPNSCPTCGRQYPAGSVVQKIQRNRFFIRQDGGRQVPSLYLDRDGQEVELVEGVEKMALAFGWDEGADGFVDVASNAPTMLTASAVSGTKCTLSPKKTDCWSKVLTVRIRLLMVTVEDGVTTSPQAYSFDGNSLPPPSDRRLRRQFETIVAVRNARFY